VSNGQAVLPRAFVQDTSYSICAQASCLQHAARAWAELNMSGRPGDTAKVLETIGATLALLTSAREEIIFTRDREEKKVTASKGADARGARAPAGQAAGA
jgi:hypothetical protein